MASDLYALSVPAFLRGFAAMDAFLDKGRVRSEEQGVVPVGKRDYLGGIS